MSLLCGSYPACDLADKDSPAVSAELVEMNMNPLRPCSMGILRAASLDNPEKVLRRRPGSRSRGSLDNQRHEEEALPGSGTTHDSCQHRWYCQWFKWRGCSIQTTGTGISQNVSSEGGSDTRRSGERAREIERSLGEIQELARQAIESPPTPTSFGPRLLLVPVQFAEYVRHADSIHRRLGHVLKATHRLERLLSILPYANPADLRRVVELQLKVENLLQSRNRTTRQTLIQIREIVDESRQVADQLLTELQGRGSRLGA